MKFDSRESGFRGPFKLEGGEAALRGLHCLHIYTTRMTLGFFLAIRV